MSLSKIRATDGGPGGIVVTTASGRERLVMSDQEICDDILATVPKLHAAVDRDTYGRRWKQKRRKNGVDVFELDTAHGGGVNGGDEDLDIVHAVVAKVELQCHLNEVLNVLIADTSQEYEATMQALCGASKFKRGDCVLSQRRVFSAQNRAQALDITKPGADVDSSPTHGHVAVKIATLRPKMRLKLKTTHKRTQKLVLAAVTQQYPSNDRAVHVIKTLPKDAHDQLVATSERSALRRELDHLAVGFNIQSTHRGGGSINHTMRVFAHGYASTTPPSSFGTAGRTKQLTSVNAADLARRRDAIMNPEARNVLGLLTKSLRQFERVIRRRRFGFQSFVYFPPGYDDPALEKACSICHKNFSFFRRDFFCQLCGHMVCTDCSQLVEVEARVGEIRKNRACIRCIVRTDSCVYDDADLVKALGPTVVDVDDAAWLNDDQFYLAGIDEEDSETADTRSLTSTSASDLDEIHEQLYSEDASLRSQALDFLGQLVDTSSCQRQYAFVDPVSEIKYEKHKAKKRARRAKSKGRSAKKEQVLEGVENHLSQSLRVLKDKYKPEHFVVADERDYTYEFDDSRTRSPDQPLPPMPTREKEAKRLEHIAASGVLEPGYDRAALDLIAEVAAKRLNCPIGFVSMVDEGNFHAIGSYNLPPDAHVLPRTNNVCIHQVYGEKPLVLKNPQRDMRFSQMACIQDLDVKFYAGFPVHAPDGSVVGSLCTADAVPHNNISTKDYATMEALARLASELVAPKREAQPPQRTHKAQATYTYSASPYAMRA